MRTPSRDLTDLLGDTRARIVGLLRDRPRSVGELARALGLSEVAVRRHLGVLEEEELIVGETVRGGGPGRPRTVYRTTERAARLMPDRTGEFANELLDYLEERLGAEAVRDFLQWRQERVSRRYADELSTSENQAGRVERLADLLSDDGFPSTVGELTEGGLALTQGHCALREVAEAHPEICQVEAEMFEDLLGVAVSRERTLAGGYSQCVCEIPTGSPSGPTDHARTRSDRDQ